MTESRDDGRRAILVFRALQLGDMLCAVPGLRALRRGHPDARIVLCGLPWATAFAERYGQYVDAFIPFPGHPRFPERAPDLSCWPGFLAEIHRWRFDLVVQAHGSGEVANPIAELFGANALVGFERREREAPGRPGFLRWDDSEHEIRRLVALAEHAGGVLAGWDIDFPISEEERASGAELLADGGPGDEPYVVVHPGAQLRSRRWPATRFGAVARMFAGLGYRVVVTGTGAERETTARVASAVPGASDLAGRTSLGEVAAIISGARLLVTNDTGVSHIAAATRTPSVVVTTGSDPGRWAPLDGGLHRVVATEVPCRPCGFADCPLPGHPCAEQVGVGDVWPAVVAALGAPAPARQPMP